MNAAAAAALARALSFSFEEISRGLSAARPYAHRSRIVAGAGGITILDDCYNASPASMEAALATLAALDGRRDGRGAVAVLGDMLELGAAEEEAHRALGTKRAGVGRRRRRLLRSPFLSYLRRILFFCLSSPRPTSPRSIRSSRG